MRGIVIAAVLALCVLPAGAELVITEIMPNPSAVSDTYGEWFEIYNEGPAPIDMYGYHIIDLDVDDCEVTEHIIVPAGGFVVFGRNANPSLNGGVDVDYECSGFYLGNSDDEIVIYDELAQLVDQVEWTPGANGWPGIPGGATLYYDWCGDNNSGTCWQAEAENVFGAGDRGTPGYDPRLPSDTDIETWSTIKALYRK